MTEQFLRSVEMTNEYLLSLWHGPYYPVGIVLMNKVANYSSTVKDILLLNNKYRLQFDPSKPVDYNPNAKAASEYDASAPTGGNAF